MVMRVLVIADDPVGGFIREALASSDNRIDFFRDPEIISSPDLSFYALLFAEIGLARRNGFTRLRQEMPNVPLILLSKAGVGETALETATWGVWDHLPVPCSSEMIRRAVAYILRVRDVYEKTIDAPEMSLEWPRFIGTSPVMMSFYKQVARVADAAVSVLIEGESGTGKELTARALHQTSLRRESPFVVIHCGAIPETLLESELFGYEKGAFTGADHAHPGLIESAQGGTLFLDEISEMAPSLQGKLLRFLQNGEVRRLGARQARHVTVRVVASTNRNMDEEVKMQRFRPDLMFRFVVRLKTPSLREHKEDLPLLVEAILRRFSPPGIRVSPAAMALLCEYDWPGNIRELENMLHQTHLLCPYTVIRPEHLSVRMRFSPDKQLTSFSPLQKLERRQIFQTVQDQGWNCSRAARILGIDRKTLRMKMHRYGLEKDGGE